MDSCANYAPNCRCLTPIINSIMPHQLSKFAVQTENTKCSGIHSTVSFRYHPLYAHPNEEYIHHTTNSPLIDGKSRIADGYGFICYPTCITSDWITQARLSNTLFCQKLNCFNFKFSWHKMSELAIYSDISTIWLDIFYNFISR